ncbi:MAG: radical SAM protein [Clostridia bacterium]|nr:radical SAM protein [Clostridia bacterium]
MRGLIFDVKEFSVHDGPGCRITVFMKGCPMRCLWCHNPEGQKAEPELMIKSSQCVHCGLCEKDPVPPFARDPGACPKGLISVSGEWIEAKDLAKRLLRFKDQLVRMKGGVTFSGGEPLAQTDFVLEAAEILRNAGVHVAVQTGGYSNEEEFQRLINGVDLVMMDLKLADEKEHIRYTGVSNEKIFKNAGILKNSGVDHIFRTPLIPGITDGKENLEAIEKLTAGSKWEKLAYNKLAGAKYPMLGRTYDEKGEIKAK